MRDTRSGASTGFPIGLADDAYEEPPIRLGAGDRLYLDSDGVGEAIGHAGKQFGNARLLEAIGRGRSVPLQASVAALVEDLERWRGSASVQDDISIVAIEVCDPGILVRRIPTMPLLFTLRTGQSKVDGWTA